MGAWSAEPFGNDTAADWAYAFDDAHNLDPLRAAFAAVTDQAGADDGEIDSDAGCEAVAAAAVVAKLLGADQSVTGFLQPELVKSLAHVGESPDSTLTGAALSALTMVRSPASELEELWEEDREWVDAVAKLDAFLRPLT